MNGKALVLFAAEACLLGGCAMLRWSGNPNPELNENWVWSTGDLALSTSTAPGAPAATTPPASLPDTLYYADLGPDEIDVAAYPLEQRRAYALFREACAGCHTLARAVNSPVESRLYWRFHLDRMNLHSRFRHRKTLTADEKKSLLDFLEYDARVRKVQDKQRFDEQTEELRRRFEPILEGILQRMRSDAMP